MAKFEDKRSWVDASDSKDQSYIAQQGAWKFALTHEGREYVPVNDLLQSLFITELRAAGFQAKSLSSIASRQSAPQLRQLGQQPILDSTFNELQARRPGHGRDAQHERRQAAARALQGRRRP